METTSRDWPKWWRPWSWRFAPFKFQDSTLHGANNSLGSYPLMKNQWFTLIRVGKKLLKFLTVELNEVRVSMECWSGHQKYQKKKKRRRRLLAIEVFLFYFILLQIASHFAFLFIGQSSWQCGHLEWIIGRAHFTRQGHNHANALNLIDYWMVIYRRLPFYTSGT